MKTNKLYLVFSFLIISWLCLAENLQAGNASNQENEPVHGLVMIIDITRKHDMQTKAFEFAGISVVPGFPVQRQSANQERVRNAENENSVFLIVTNVDGEIIHIEPLIFPVLKTIPPTEPGASPDEITPYIQLEMQSTSVIIPFYPDAHELIISQNNMETLREHELLVDAITEGLLISPQPEETRTTRSDLDQLNIMIMASGFTSTNMAVFHSKANEIKNFFLSVEPFASRIPITNIIIYPQLNPLGCYAGCYGIDRLMCCNTSQVMSAAATSGFEVDEIIVLHNTSTYSGGGYRESGTHYMINSLISYAMVYNGIHSATMALHEFGHSFGNLCDEYTYDGGPYVYDDCVNCRASCADWSDINEECQLGCDAEANYFRPENSIMLALNHHLFNQPTLKATYFPHGLEKRFDFFAQMPTIPGDSNCDGEVNVLDVITTANYILGNNPQPFCFENADVNGDGVINVIDVTGTINIILSGGFVCGVSTITDVDGNIYNTVLIGNQCWMKENLKTTHYRNGTPIEYPGSDNSAWQNNTSGAYAWYQNNISWKENYGALYNWYAVNNTNGLCPEGWHVPGDDEWNNLILYLDPDADPNAIGSQSDIAGGKLKSMRTAPEAHPRWNSPNTGASNESNWTGFPGGYRSVHGTYATIGFYGSWWSHDENQPDEAWTRYLSYFNAYVYRASRTKTFGYSIRCLKD